MLIFSELHNIGEMVLNKMKNVPLYHTYPMMDMDRHEQREASTALALAAQNKDMNMLHEDSHLANTDHHICALGVILVSLHDWADKHSSLHSSFDIYPIVQRR